MSLHLTNISRRFGKTAAVAGASLSVADCEIVCLFGPSGCGKTTLLRVAAGLEPLESGSVSVDGDILAANGVAHPPETRPIGFVFQDFVLFPHLTALENVTFGLRHLPRAAQQETAREELARVGLAGFEKRYPHQLSGGQQQRVALARAFARRPRAMLLDEPFASIDAVLRRKLRNDVRAILKDHGAATILVTHDPEEALALGDRIAIMDRGRIIEVASPRALFDTPKTAAGASLFAGSQALAGKRRGDEVVTAFGPTQAQGGPDGATLVVVQPGGAEMIADPDGNAVAEECRFVGPHWTVALAAGDQQVFLTVSAPEPVEPGARFSVRFNPSRIKVFDADEGRIDAGGPAA
ncbi:MAG: ABC transporter ATP-binding protein [Amphiplicatus sp.]